MVTKDKHGRVLSRKRRERIERNARKFKTKLIEMLTDYIRGHYANCATGYPGVIHSGPVIARLQAAASLRALLESPHSDDFEFGAKE